MAHKGMGKILRHGGLGLAACMAVSLALVSAKGDTVITNCSEVQLREAVAAGGKITFSCSGTIVVREPMTVTNEVLLDGTGAQVAISGNGTNRLFNVHTNRQSYLAPAVHCEWECHQRWSYL